MKTNFNEVVKFAALIGVGILELGIIKKLDDIHEEIKYFERCKSVYYSKKQNDSILKREWEELKQKREEEA